MNSPLITLFIFGSTITSSLSDEPKDLTENESANIKESTVLTPEDLGMTKQVFTANPKKGEFAKFSSNSAVGHIQLSKDFDAEKKGDRFDFSIVVMPYAVAKKTHPKLQAKVEYGSWVSAHKPVKTKTKTKTKTGAKVK